jgi:hypothetical protein
MLEHVGDEVQPVRHCWLYRCEDRSPFAYARGDEFVRNADHKIWALQCDNKLLSVRSGECLAYRVGSVFYDADSHEPLYYQPPMVALPGNPPFGEVGAVRATREASPHRIASLRSTTAGR